MSRRLNEIDLIYFLPPLQREDLCVMWETEIRHIGDLKYVPVGSLVQFSTPMRVSMMVEKLTSNHGILIEGPSISRPGPHYISMYIPAEAPHGNSDPVVIKDGDETVISSTGLDHLISEPKIGTVLMHRDSPHVGEIPMLVPSDLRFVSDRSQLVLKSADHKLVLKLNSVQNTKNGGIAGSAQVVNSTLGHHRGALVNFEAKFTPDGVYTSFGDDPVYFTEISTVEQTRRRSSSDSESPRELLR